MDVTFSVTSFRQKPINLPLKIVNTVDNICGSLNWLSQFLLGDFPELAFSSSDSKLDVVYIFSDCLGERNTMVKSVMHFLKVQNLA